MSDILRGIEGFVWDGGNSRKNERKHGVTDRMKKKIRQVPKFRKEQDEREFWNTHDTTDYLDFSDSNRVEIEFDPGVEAPVKSISLRLPREMLNQLKVLANEKDIPYESLIKVFLAEKIAQERKAS
jgi:predicted DNA binding CopG/RHH family protein